MIEELEKVCINCNHFFPASMNEPTEFGICLQDPEFDAYIDELFEDQKSTSCQKLVQSKKFPGDRDACNDFDMIEEVEIDDETALGKTLSGLIEKGELTKESFEEAIWEEQINQMDLKNLPVDGYLEKLHESDCIKKKKAVESLGGLIAMGNDKAYDALFSYFRDFPPPETIEAVHFKLRIFNYLKKQDKRTLLIPVVIDKIYQTPSNNTTRQLIVGFFRFLQTCPSADVKDPLEKMLESKKIAYRLKKKIKSILAR